MLKDVEWWNKKCVNKNKVETYENWGKIGFDQMHCEKLSKLKKISGME